MYLIDEKERNIYHIIKEPTWLVFNDSSKKVLQASLCDLIIQYEDKSFRPIELKYSRRQQGKGIHQINQGYLYGIQQLRMPYLRTGKLVLYGSSKNDFEYDEVSIPSYYLQRSPPEILQDMYKKGEIDI